MVRLSGGVEVEWLEVDRSSGCAVLFGTDHHACYWFTNWDRFKDPQSHVPV